MRVLAFGFLAVVAIVAIIACGCGCRTAARRWSAGRKAARVHAVDEDADNNAPPVGAN
jgi:hypothetical protein